MSRYLQKLTKILIYLQSRFLTGNYLLISNRSKFNQFKVNTSCPFCKTPEETREHVLVNCPIYDKERADTITRIYPLLQDINRHLSYVEWKQLLLDCSLSEESIPTINEETRILVYQQAMILICKMARKRYRLLNQNRG